MGKVLQWQPYPGKNLHSASTNAYAGLSDASGLNAGPYASSSTPPLLANGWRQITIIASVPEQPFSITVEAGYETGDEKSHVFTMDYLQNLKCLMRRLIQTLTFFR